MLSLKSVFGTWQKYYGTVIAFGYRGVMACKPLDDGGNNSATGAMQQRTQWKEKRKEHERTKEATQGALHIQPRVGPPQLLLSELITLQGLNIEQMTHTCLVIRTLLLPP